MPRASNFWSRKQNCCRCQRIVTSAMGTAERLRHWAAQKLTFCLTQEIILIHINTHRIHVWYNGIYANIGGILMVLNVTIYIAYMDPMGYNSYWLRVDWKAIFGRLLRNNMLFWDHLCSPHSWKQSRLSNLTTPKKNGSLGIIYR